MRSGSVRARLEMVAAMAQPIEFYVPEKLRRQRVGQWIPPEQRGKIIPFPHRNQMPPDIKTPHLVSTSDKSSWQDETGSCSAVCGDAYLDW
jgi:hypothetical protein